jgi:hypothetical protein
MYNETYVREFDEKYYLESLSDFNKLEGLRLVSNQYSNNADANYLAFKESLDHYVMKRLINDPKFIDTKEFQNYLHYALRTSNNKELRATDKYSVYPELITNPVFRNDEIRNKIFNKYLSKEQINGFERLRVYSKKVVDYVFEEMKNNHRLTQDLINIAADYIYSSKDFSNDKGEIFSKYILNNAKELNIKCNAAIGGAFTTIFGQYFDLDDDVKNSRFFIANYDSKNKTNIAHSSGQFKYCVFSKDVIDKLSLTNCESLLKSRSMKNYDIYWLMFVSFHELTHQHQGYDNDKGKFTTSGISCAIKRILNKHMPKRNNNGREICDYNVNHDSDETEMEADEEGWRQTRKFIHQMVNHDNRRYIDEKGEEQDKWVLAFDNEKVVRARRAFTVKQDVDTYFDKTSSGMYYAYYDLMHLERIMKEHPEERNNNEILKRLFNSDGSLNVIDILSYDLYRNSQKDQMSWNSSNNAGLEIGTYVVNHKWKEVLDTIDKGYIKTKKQAFDIGNNMYHIIHENVLKVRDFDKIATEESKKRKYDGIDVSQYDETKVRFDLKDPNLSKRLHEYYFKSVCIGVKRFYEYKSLMKSKYNLDVSDEGMYLDSYVYEMYATLVDKDEKSCMEILGRFKDSNSSELTQIYEKIMNSKQVQMNNNFGRSR